MKKILLLLLLAFSLGACAPEEPPVATDPWGGFTMEATDVTSKGLTLLCTQAGGDLRGSLQTGSYYKIQAYKNDIWVNLDYVLSDVGQIWTNEVRLIPKDSSFSWPINWEWLYGELPPGEYRIKKTIHDYVKKNDFDVKECIANFTVPE